jgi:hypothetical protein
MQCRDQLIGKRYSQARAPRRETFGSHVTPYFGILLL